MEGEVSMKSRGKEVAYSRVKVEGLNSEQGSKTVYRETGYRDTKES